MIIEELIALLGFDLEGEGDLNRFKAGLDGAEKNAQRAAKRIDALSVAIGSFVGTVAAQAAMKLGNVIGSLPGDVLKTGAEFEALGIRLETLEGSAEKAQAALDWVRKFAATTPLDLAQAADAYANLKNYGLDPTTGSLQAMVDAMSASGKGVAQLDRLVLALGQAWVKQKLQGGEILQLTEAGIPVWDMLAAATGKNVAELQKLSSAGKLGRKEIQLLIDAIGDKYAGASEKFAKSFAGVTDKIGEQWTDFKKRVADAGFFQWFKDGANDMLDVLEKWEKDGTLDAWARRTSKAFTSVGDGLKRFGQLSWRIGGWVWDGIGKAADAINRLAGTEGTLFGLAAAFAAIGFAISPWTTALALFILVLDDFVSWLDGKKSVIGKALDWLAAKLKDWGFGDFDFSPEAFKKAVKEWTDALGDFTAALGLGAALAIFRLGGLKRGLTGLTGAMGSFPLFRMLLAGAAVKTLYESFGDVRSIEDFQTAIANLSAMDWALIAGGITSLVGPIGKLTGALKPLAALGSSLAWLGGLAAFSLNLGQSDLLKTEEEKKRDADHKERLKEYFDPETGDAARSKRLERSSRTKDDDVWAGKSRWEKDVGTTPEAKVPLLEMPSDPAVFNRLIDELYEPIKTIKDRASELNKPRADGTGQLQGLLQSALTRLNSVSGSEAVQAATQTVANDNRVLNQSNTVNAPVTVNATLTNTTPAAIGAAAGAGVRSGGNSAVRSLAVTGVPSFGGPR